MQVHTSESCGQLLTNHNILLFVQARTLTKNLGFPRRLNRYLAARQGSPLAEFPTSGLRAEDLIEDAESALAFAHISELTVAMQESNPHT